ncbi:MAG: hypothetical protein ACO3Z6_14305, partial [Pseudomonadales bacterium]
MKSERRPAICRFSTLVTLTLAGVGSLSASDALATIDVFDSVVATDAGTDPITEAPVTSSLESQSFSETTQIVL